MSGATVVSSPQRIVVNVASASATVVSQTQRVIVNSSATGINLVSKTQHIVVSPSTAAVNVISTEQKIVVNAAASSVSVINTGPMGPRGLTGPPDAGGVLTVDGQIMTRVLGGLAPITRAALAADTAFTTPISNAVSAAITTHLAASDPHPVYMTAAEDATVMSAHTSAADPHPGYLTPVEGDAAYVNVGGDSMTGGLQFPNGGNFIQSATDNAFISFHNAAFAARRAYMQGHSAGLNIVAEAGRLTLNGVDGINMTPFKINGYTATETAVASRIVLANSSGYIFATYFNATANVVSGYPPYYAGQNGDNYIRWYDHAGTFVAARVEGSSNGGSWTTTALSANPANGIAGISFHPSGVAPTIAAYIGAGDILYVRNANGSTGSASLAAANYYTDSSERWKRNINSWPSSSLSHSSVIKSDTSATDIISKLRPVTFQMTTSDIEIPSDRRTKAWLRLNAYRSSKGLPDYLLPEHNCDKHVCNGTIDNPCTRMIEVNKTRHGFIAEEVYAVIPAAVRLDTEHKPEGIDYAQLVSISMAAIRELTERIRVLEAV